MTSTLSLQSVSEITIPEFAILLSEAVDITLLVNQDGEVEDFSVNTTELHDGIDKSWTGEAWTSLVAAESMERIEEIILNSAAHGRPVWREINHYFKDQTPLPIRFYCFPVGKTGKTLALGKDLRAIAVLQQQLLNAQQSIEQDYWRLRQVETRYRLIFDMVGDAIVVIDEPTSKVLETNLAASHLLSAGVRTILGKSFPIGFDESSNKEILSLLAETRVTGKSSIRKLHITGSDNEYKMSSILIRQDNESRFLVRISQANTVTHLDNPVLRNMHSIINNAPDAVVVTNQDGEIQFANLAFLQLAQIVSEEQAINQSIERWLGRTGVDLNILLKNLKEHGQVKLYMSTIHGEHGFTTSVEISATSITNIKPNIYAITIRDVGRRVSASTADLVHLPKSVDQFTQQVGQLPLKEIVRESNNFIEKNCIETALKLTGDNRASAAELLGLSRQSLYAKLRTLQINETEAH